MALVRHAIREHDVVRLRKAIEKTDGGGSWAAGTSGTVVSDYGKVKLVEIAEVRVPGAMLDLLQVAEADLELEAAAGV
jgi:hypothetical protein